MLVYYCMKANVTDFTDDYWKNNCDRLYERYGKVIKRTLNHKRNCCQSTVKTILKGKLGRAVSKGLVKQDDSLLIHVIVWITELLRKNVFTKTSLPGVVGGPEKAMEVGKEMVLESDYAKLMLNFLRTIVGDAAYADNIMKRPIPAWVNTSDEALAIVLVENCWKQECDIHFGKKLSPDAFIRENAKRTEKKRCHGERTRKRRRAFGRSEVQVVKAAKAGRRKVYCGSTHS
jgi:hypothetical protein